MLVMAVLHYRLDTRLVLTTFYLFPGFFYICHEQFLLLRSVVVVVGGAVVGRRGWLLGVGASPPQAPDFVDARECFDR